MQHDKGLDPVFASDRASGATAPEPGARSANVVGRPVDDAEEGGFHEGTETPAVEREAFSQDEALAEGGSYDGLGIPAVDDSAP